MPLKLKMLNSSDHTVEQGWVNGLNIFSLAVIIFNTHFLSMNLHTDALNKESLRFNMYEVLKTLISMYLSTKKTTKAYKLLLHSGHKMQYTKVQSC